MLVLSRKSGEAIVLPGLGVSITVLGVHGKRVRIGITAPPELAVHREEVLQRAFAAPGAGALNSSYVASLRCERHSRQDLQP